MKLIDLSIPISSGMDVYPGDPAVSIDLVRTYAKDGYQVRKLSMGTHTASHVDAFSHMHPGMASLDDIPLSRYMAPSLVVDLLRADWPRGQGLFFDQEVGLERLDDILACQPPLVGGRISPDLERALLAKSILTYTDLINLDKIEKMTRFIFIGFPLAIEGGDASPVRAVALLDIETEDRG